MAAQQKHGAVKFSGISNDLGGYPGVRWLGRGHSRKTVDASAGRCSKTDG